MSEQTFSGSVRSRCRDIMTQNVRTASREMSLKEVASLMNDGDMGAVPVVADGKLIGIVTDRDIVVRAVAEGMDPESTTVGDVMTADLQTAKPDDFAFEAIRMMGEKQVRRIPIVDGEGRLQGIVSMADVALQTEDELQIAEALEEISSGSGFWKNS